MATVYYDFDAISNGAGTSADPRNTWANPANGDVIRIRRGNRWVRASQLNFSTFTNITVETWAYADGTDDLTGAKPIINHSAASTFAWNFVGDGIHRIRNLRFENCSTNANGGVLGAGTVAATSVGAQLDVRGCEFEGSNYNAIRLSATLAAASPTFSALDNTFDNIGEDAVYGGALVYEFGRNTCRRLSTNSITGDAVGFFQAVPTFAWIHNNFIDHGADYKQCVIIDSSTDHAGYALIEDNYLIGYGDEETEAFGHTVINGNARMVVRRNTILTAGIAVNALGNAAEIYGNLIVVRNRQASAPLVIALQGSSSTVFHNTLVGTRDFDSCKGVVQATGQSGNSIRNNLIVGLTDGISTSGGTDPTVSNNAMWQVATPYAGGSLAAVDDVTTDPRLTTDYRPLEDSPLIGAGAHLGYTTDIDGVQRFNPPTIGAYEPVRARSAASAREAR